LFALASSATGSCRDCGLEPIDDSPERLRQPRASCAANSYGHTPGPTSPTSGQPARLRFRRSSTDWSLSTAWSTDRADASLLPGCSDRLFVRSRAVRSAR